MANIHKKLVSLNLITNVDGFVEILLEKRDHDNRDNTGKQDRYNIYLTCIMYDRRLPTKIIDTTKAICNTHLTQATFPSSIQQKDGSLHLSQLHPLSLSRAYHPMIG